MSDVVHRARKGQGSDPSAACELLAQFVKAANALCEGWDPELDRGYPGYLPSFDEFIEALIDWREVVEEKQAVDEDEEIAPLNVADPAAFRRWLGEVRGQMEDAVAAGEDATRAPGQRGLGRLKARRMVVEARRALLQLLSAAERGLG